MGSGACPSRRLPLLLLSTLFFPPSCRRLLVSPSRRLPSSCRRLLNSSLPASCRRLSALPSPCSSSPSLSSASSRRLFPCLYLLPPPLALAMSQSPCRFSHAPLAFPATPPSFPPSSCSAGFSALFSASPTLDLVSEGDSSFWQLSASSPLVSSSPDLSASSPPYKATDYQRCLASLSCPPPAGDVSSLSCPPPAGDVSSLPAMSLPSPAGDVSSLSCRRCLFPLFPLLPSLLNPTPIWRREPWYNCLRKDICVEWDTNDALTRCL